jgi:hypothetical protein
VQILHVREGPIALAAPGADAARISLAEREIEMAVAVEAPTIVSFESPVTPASIERGNPPAPSPKSTVIEPLKLPSRSACPSSSTSPIATRPPKLGALAGRRPTGALNVPSPAP